jgi:hypothetical protein
VPQQRRQEKKVARRKMPLTSWRLEPVRLSLSKNQWKLRKGEESS